MDGSGKGTDGTGTDGTGRLGRGGTSPSDEPRFLNHDILQDILSRFKEANRKEP